MIGKLCIALFPYFDQKTLKNMFKKRPVLIISNEKNNDYTILPVSTITNKLNIDKKYDVEIVPDEYPNLKLNKLSYIRTHKQTVIYKALIYEEISNLKEEYFTLYLDIIKKLKEYNEDISKKF